MLNFRKNEQQGSGGYGFNPPAPPQPFGQFGQPYQQPYGQHFMQPEEKKKSGGGFLLSIVFLILGVALGYALREIKNKMGELKPKVPFRKPEATPEVVEMPGPAKEADPDPEKSFPEQHRDFVLSGYRAHSDGGNHLDGESKLNNEDDLDEGNSLASDEEQ